MFTFSKISPFVAVNEMHIIRYILEIEAQNLTAGHVVITAGVIVHAHVNKVF
jgi:hypothetical protein